MVVEVVPRNGDVVRGADDVDLAVILVRALGDIRGKLIVVNPNTSTVSDGDTIGVENIADLEVLEDDIVSVKDINTLAGDMGRSTKTNQGSVGSNLETSSKLNLSLDPHDLGFGASNSSDELLSSANNSRGSSLATSSDANWVVLGITLNSPRSNLEIVVGKCTGQANKAIDKSETELHGRNSRQKGVRKKEGIVKTEW